MYSSPSQLNVQVPYEIAGAATTDIKVVNQNIVNPLSETRTVSVAQRQPSLFLSRAALLSAIPGWSLCGGLAIMGQAAAALNADGTLNDCTNPAPAGTPVTVIMNGAGVTVPAFPTGALYPSPAVALTPSLDPGSFTGTTVTATETIPGVITGVAQVQLVPGQLSQLLIDPKLDGTPLRERVIVVWTR
jgi:uncharacterized protein (TIGR03437 family)